VRGAAGRVPGQRKLTVRSVCRGVRLRGLDLAGSVRPCRLIRARPRVGFSRLVASLRGELADALAALGETRAELGQAQERIAEREARLG
jgi:hypothetical protein